MSINPSLYALQPIASTPKSAREDWFQFNFKSHSNSPSLRWNFPHYCQSPLQPKSWRPGPVWLRSFVEWCAQWSPLPLQGFLAQVCSGRNRTSYLHIPSINIILILSDFFFFLTIQTKNVKPLSIQSICANASRFFTVFQSVLSPSFTLLHMVL